LAYLVIGRYVPVWYSLLVRWIIIVLGLGLFSSCADAAGRALVIGNARYGTDATTWLPTPTNDAQDIWSLLTELGYEAGPGPYLNLDLTSMRGAIRDFARSLQPKDTVLVYFSGHGVEVNGVNYLMPTGFQKSDAGTSSAGRIKGLAVELNHDLIRPIRERTSGPVVVVLDACRDHSSFLVKGSRNGLAPFAADGMFIAFAASPGQIAIDGSQRNSLFTRALLETLSHSELDIHGVFEEVRRLVKASVRSQVPYLNDGLPVELYFRGQSAPRPNAELVTPSSTPPIARFPQSPKPSTSVDKEKLQTNARELGPQARRRNSLDGLYYRWIPAGRWEVGCLEEEPDCSADSPVRQGDFAEGFWMGETEVTQEAFERIMKTNPSGFRGARFPVEMVDFREAQQFCGRAGGRLPRDEEWEYAARAGERRRRYADLESSAWYFDNAERRTHVAGGKKENSWGLVDVLGNVGELTESWFDEGERLRRVVRGGSFEENAETVGVEFRGDVLPKERFTNVGFRCILPARHLDSSK
jgi:hypothetical protein